MEVPMALFIVRVELHQHRPGDYEQLHQQMAAQGLQRTLRASDGKDYHLPPAEYAYVGEIEDQKVILERTKTVAARVRPSFEVLVTKAITCTWHNLKPV
jgi:hypothetical protein